MALPSIPIARQILSKAAGDDAQGLPGKLRILSVGFGESLTAQFSVHLNRLHATILAENRELRGRFRRIDGEAIKMYKTMFGASALLAHWRLSRLGDQWSKTFNVGAAPELRIETSDANVTLRAAM